MAATLSLGDGWGFCSEGLEKVYGFDVSDVGLGRYCSSCLHEFSIQQSEAGLPSSVLERIGLVGERYAQFVIVGGVHPSLRERERERERERGCAVG